MPPHLNLPRTEERALQTSAGDLADALFYLNSFGIITSQKPDGAHLHPLNLSSPSAAALEKYRVRPSSKTARYYVALNIAG
jgi:hypothetical protein